VLFRRGWNKYDLAGLASGNIIRVIEKAEAVVEQMKKEGVQAAYDLYDKRKDLPVKLPTEL
jgi:membrane dipeptidase